MPTISSLQSPAPRVIRIRMSIGDALLERICLHVCGLMRTISWYRWRQLLAVASGLPVTDSFFMQACPLCGTRQRMMIRGNWIDDKGKWHRYPDMGYSFCNCKDIFFTKIENVTELDTTWNNCSDLLAKLSEDLDKGEFTISMLDPFFIVWNSPHEMWHWLLRKVYYIIDMESFCNLCREIGFEIVSAIRDMDVNSKTPQNFHVTVRKR